MGTLNSASVQHSRRRFLGTAASVAGLAATSPIALAQQAAQPPQEMSPRTYFNPPDVNWRLAVRYVTGGAPYRPAFASMFFDPMFVQMEFGPIDLGATASPSIGTRAGSGAGRGGGRGGRGAAAGAAGAAAAQAGRVGATPGAPLPPTGNAPLNASEVPPDMPIIPSGGVRAGLSQISSLSQSVVLLNDQTNWENTQAIETAFNANQELLGIVIFHNAVGDNQKWPLWYQEIAGGLLVLEDQPGMKKSTVTKGASYDVKPVGTHPIVQDLQPFKVTGEDAYKGMWQSTKITPLLEATGPSTDRVVAWVGPNPDKARVVVIAPGTSNETFRNPSFRRLVRNSLLWAGHRLE
jgi:hypothetical protein